MIFILLMIAVIANYNLEIYQMDVEIAFLHGEIF
jgi:hypothetical protein